MSSPITRRSFLGAVSVITGSSLFTAPAAAVAPALQGAILAKVLNYDQTLSGRSPKVLIIAMGTDGDAKALAAAFEKLEAAVKVVEPAAFNAAQASWGDAAYFVPGQLTAAAGELCRTHNVLSMSASVSDVEAGRASVGVGVSGGKPEIVINVTRVGLEGHKLSSRLLSLARVVR